MVNIITSGQTYWRRYHKSNNNTQNRSNTILKYNITSETIIYQQKLQSYLFVRKWQYY